MRAKSCQPAAGEPPARPLSRRELLAGALAAGVAAACGGSPRPASRVPADALALHRESLVLDLHVDTLLWMRLVGYDLTRHHSPLLPAAAFAWQMDLPRAAEGGLDGAVLGIVVAPDEEQPEQHPALKLHRRVESGSGLAQTLATLDLLAETARSHPGRLRFAHSGSEVREAAEAGQFAALAALEGAHGLGDRVENLLTAFSHGLRMVGLVHFQRSGAAFPMTEPDFADRGLTAFGRSLVEEMSSLGMLVDLAHVNARGVEESLALLRRPCVVSHSACRALHDHPRNLYDDQIRRVADRGGVLGLAVGRSFVGRGGLEAYLAHVEHARRVGGESAVAIGSDWDGAIVPVPGMEDVRALPWVTHGLLERGWAPEAIRKLLGGNALRVLSDVCG